MSIFLIGFVCFTNLNAQESENSKLYTSLGYFVSLSAFPVYEEANDVETKIRQEGVLDFGYSYGFKYNIKNLNDNSSISLNARPGLGLGWTPGIGFISLRVPVSAAMNTGVGSTYDTDSDYGFGLDLGLEYLFSPLWKTTDVKERKVISDLSPFAQISFRYWKTSKNRLHEIFIRANLLGSNDEDLIEKYTDFDTISPFAITFGFNRYLNY